MQKIWPFSLNVLFYAAIAFVTPFTVLYYQSLGLSGAQIGILVGLVPLVTMFGAPLFTGLADVTQRHRLVMGVTMLVGCIATLLVPFFPQVAPTILLIFTFNIFFSPVGAFTDSATLFMLADKKEMYGRIRVGGTLGFGLAAIPAGILIQNYGLRMAFWGSGVLCLLGLLVSQKLVFGTAIKGTAAPRSGIRSLLTNPHWLLFLALAFAGSMAMASVNSYLFSYMKELGADGNMMGYALAFGTISEVPILFFGNRLLKRFGARKLMALAMLIAGARLLATAAFNTSVLVLLIQFVSGLTFPLMWMAGVSYTEENAPPGMSATAQGLFSAVVFGFGTAMGGFLGGTLLENLGGRGMYFVFGAIVLVAVVIVTLIENRMSVKQQIIPNDI